MRNHVSRLLVGAAFAVSVFPVAAADAPDEVGRFEIKRFEVSGNTLLTTQAVERAVAPFAGKDRNFGHVQMALEALEAEYHRLGFNVVQVALPEQELNQGVVKLQVVETRLGKVRVEGNQHFSEANIRNSLPGLVEGRTPNIGQVSASLRLANENPAKKTALQLQSGDEDIDATLKVTDDKPWKLSASLDNSGNKNTGESQLTLQYQHANIADRDQVLSLQYTTTLEHPSKIGVYGVGYHIPLYALGDSIDLFGSYSNVDSGSVLAGIVNLQVSGRGTVVGGRYNQVLRRKGDYDSRFIYGIDHKAFNNSVLLQGAQLGNDVTVHPLSVAYVGSWSGAENAVNFNLTALRNIPGGGKGGSSDFNAARPGAEDAYRILRYSADYSRVLPAAWQLHVSLSGQYTNDVLIPGEQFGAGGASSVRGFTERDASNDIGHMASAEVYTPELCAGSQDAWAQCRMLAFYDTAQLRNNGIAPATVSIGSAGLGLRLNAGKTMALQLDYGQVIDAGNTRSKGDRRLHVKIALSY
ncbi:ShlB/FhaC/HecB family hemolysin secretion/activation protein [Herbaspirillum sp. ST 5-3]|uniref:ShlB/FhaC/HecB family hemolysin secretion/activation protein n=1 Tax=Oxalobacteraceae TaxID=75682 RepID=UPI0010A37641|nr:ShlB/FhaC/HecB family hemolysin secretion/activation protein [Herbaspirillum sp. ST 5-3]